MLMPILTLILMPTLTPIITLTLTLILTLTPTLTPTLSLTLTLTPTLTVAAAVTFLQLLLDNLQLLLYPLLLPQVERVHSGVVEDFDDFRYVFPIENYQI